MQVRETKLPGVRVLIPKRFRDSRGFFAETYNRRIFEDLGISCEFVQDNRSFSAAAGTIRGLHFQLPPWSQAKLVHVIRGAVLDIAVDLRVGSPTYGKWIAERLSEGGGEQLYVPRGFAHGFCTLEADTQVSYKVDNFYAPRFDSGIIWNDPSLDIAWPFSSARLTLSEKDLKLSTFSELHSPFRFEHA